IYVALYVAPPLAGLQRNKYVESRKTAGKLLCPQQEEWEHLRMATIYQTNNGNYRADIRIKGAPRHSRVFDTKADATAWARETEASIKQARKSGRMLPTSITLREALATWQHELKDYVESDSRQGVEHRPRLANYSKTNKSRFNIWLAH